MEDLTRFPNEPVPETDTEHQEPQTETPQAELADCQGCGEQNVAAQQTCPPNTFAYTVQPGDTMFTIARRFNVSLDALIAANPQIPDPSRIIPGQIVCVPTTQPGQCPAGTFPYTVQPGDTMFLIAQRFGVSLNALIAANPQIPDPSRIVPGQIVCVPTTPPTQCPPGTFAYTVRPGDTMFLIAQRFGVSLNALIAANPQIPNPNQIRPGQIVCVPTTPSGQCPPGTFAYTVRPGDTMFLIAQRFGVSLNALIAANPQIPNPNQIRPGQIVCVPTSSSAMSFTTTTEQHTAPISPTIATRNHPATVQAKKVPKCPENTFRYTVQSGDSLFRIARRFGISLDSLIKANPQITDPNRIMPGQQICVPRK